MQVTRATLAEAHTTVDAITDATVAELTLPEAIEAVDIARNQLDLAQMEVHEATVLLGEAQRLQRRLEKIIAEEEE